MYTGIIGRWYSRKKNTEEYKLISVTSFDVKLSNDNELIYVSLENFLDWYDCKEEMYVRQVGQMTIQFPE